MKVYDAYLEQDSLNLKEKLEVVCRNPVVDSLMQSVSGLLAILDEQGQFLTVNDYLLQYFGISVPETVLGMRPGEVIACIHARQDQGGCGCTKYCSTCGAGIAIADSLSADKVVERQCAATIEINGRLQEICFMVRSSPIIFDNQRFLLLFMQDITEQYNRAALERIFFHDVSNVLISLQLATEHLDRDRDNGKLIEMIRRSGRRLKNEIEIQRSLSRTKATNYSVSLSRVKVDQIISEVEAVVGKHETASQKFLVLPENLPDLELTTDPSLLVRILLNMLINAFEVTEPGGQVKLWIEQRGAGTAFMVWNHGEIPPEIRPRIFQRHFSTKPGLGRGLGTYAMKLFGENILGGKVDFSTSSESGTTFRFTIS